MRHINLCVHFVSLYGISERYILMVFFYFVTLIIIVMIYGVLFGVIVFLSMISFSEHMLIAVLTLSPLGYSAFFVS